MVGIISNRVKQHGEYQEILKAAGEMEFASFL
jgi:hypothetical protein